MKSPSLAPKHAFLNMRRVLWGLDAGLETGSYPLHGSAFKLLHQFAQIRNFLYGKATLDLGVSLKVMLM